MFPDEKEVKPQKKKQKKNKTDDEKEVKPQKKKQKQDKKLKYENRVWNYDARPDPFKKGKPWWTAYDDIISTVIEVHF